MLVAGVGDGLWEEAFGLGDEASEEVEAGWGVSDPGEASSDSEAVEGLFEHDLGVVADGGWEVVIAAGLSHGVWPSIQLWWVGRPVMRVGRFMARRAGRFGGGAWRGL